MADARGGLAEKAFRWTLGETVSSDVLHDIKGVQTLLITFQKDLDGKFGDIVESCVAHVLL